MNRRELIVENLYSKIEDLRKKMHRAALEKGIRDPEVLIISCKLDEAINQFQKMDLDSRRKKDQYLKWFTSMVEETVVDA